MHDVAVVVFVKRRRAEQGDARSEIWTQEKGKRREQAEKKLKGP
jgi:hypothetical protein